MRNNLYSARIAWLLAVTAATPIFASPVTVTGGFTSFEGLIGGCGQFTSTINGRDVSPTGCDPLAGSLVQTLVTFSSTPSVEFSQRQFFETTDNLRNLISFAPAGPQEVAAPGTRFLLGILTYENGIWNGHASLHLTLTTVSTNPLLNGHTLDTILQLRLTSNVGSFGQNADYIYFPSYPDTGSLRAYELFDSPTGTNASTAELWGIIGSLIPTDFANPQGGGFVSGSVTDDPGSSVPEPGTCLLTGVALVGLLRSRSRR